MTDFILGDCMEYMKQMPDNAFELAIVDPPYGIDLANMNMGVGKSKKASKIQNRQWNQKGWDKETPSEEYFAELFRVSKNQIIWGGNYFPLPPCKHYIIWDKEIPKGLSFADCEMAWASFDKAPKMFRYSAYLDKGRKFHPTQKPVALFEHLIRTYTNSGDTILDNCAGSGTTGVAAENLGRNSIMIEQDPKYCEVIRKRLSNMQQTIFNL